MKLRYQSVYNSNWFYYLLRQALPRFSDVITSIEWANNTFCHINFLFLFIKRCGPTCTSRTPRLSNVEAPDLDKSLTKNSKLNWAGLVAPSLTPPGKFACTLAPNGMTLTSSTITGVGNWTCNSVNQLDFRAFLKEACQTSLQRLLSC